LRLGPIGRVSAGLIGLLVSLVLVANFVLDAVPSRGLAERQARQRVAENLAIQITSLLEAGDEVMVGKTIQQVLARDADIRAINVRRHDGSSVLRRGEPGREGPVGQASTSDRLRVPILAGKQAWGEVEVRFAAEPATLTAALAHPAVQMLAVLAIGGFLLAYAYLRRAMQFLNPSASVPDRVRKAFDTLTEGVVILDQQARIVLANAAFRRLHPQASADLNGQHIDGLAWLAAGRNPDEPTPWAQTLQSSVTVESEPLALPQPEAPPTRLLVTTAAIADDKGRARGCMVTFDDVTAVHLANDELRLTLAKLQQSRQQIEEQNLELRRLATRDALTGCFNRRAFFEFAQDAFETARGHGGDICCVMADIDKFKQFNDFHGHAAGDQVIRAVAAALARGLRQQDILCRYGGEEFCIILPGATPDVAFAVAERLRSHIESHASQAIRKADVGAITASFGVSTRVMGAISVEELIDQADQALYRSKDAGRNRVTLFDRVAA
jgi:diguanylate cyclase (GGDEF)-like protein